MTALFTEWAETPDDVWASMNRKVFTMLALILLALFSAGIPVLVFLLSRRSLVFAPENLNFKASRISILGNAKSKFGATGLFEFFKSFVKLLIFSAILGIFILVRNQQILGSLHTAPDRGIVLMVSLAFQVCCVACIVALLIGGLDMIWQKQNFLSKHRMSRQDIKDETRRSEGDPEMKAARQRKAREVSQNRMLLDVPNADVVVVNPTHYAVALAWERSEKGSAPKCVAKGVDHIATRIREIAQENGVPIYSDPPTARALFASVELGQEVQFEFFGAVAAAIRFADRLNSKAGPNAHG